MKCPVDGIDMIVVEHRKIELDHCVRCSGVWFDASELELLLLSAGMDPATCTPGKLLSRPERPPTEARRKCPICGKRMDKVFIGTEAKVLIDACPREHGLWFDGGELGQLVTQLAGKGAADCGDVLSFLGTAFEAKGKPDSTG